MERKGNINFVLVGARATGKTVYLASLYLNSKCVTAEDSETIQYLKPLADTLLKGNYPSATAGSLHEMQFNYRDKNFNASIQIDDVDGYFIETLSELDESTQVERDRFIRNLELSEGIMFFFPYQQTFNGEAIREFNYQIDMIISKLKKIYSNRKSLPTPAVIAVSKWDDSPDYKSKNEEKKVLEYIEQTKFLKFAKEKIELNFSKLKIIPISATGSNIQNIEPYNLEKPLEFFLKETYSNWIKKIESLKEDKEAQFIFLSKIHIDIKLYGQYDKLYHSLEKEYSEKLFKELKSIKKVDAYKVFEKKNSKIIDALLSENKDKILERKKRLTTQKRVKRFSGTFFAVVSVVIMIVGGLLWKNKSLFLKNEAELFSNIETEYTTHNFEEALKDISDYQSKDRRNINHKNRVVEIKSLIEKSKIVDEAKSILDDSNFNNTDRIDEIFTSFSEMGIDNPALKKELILKKDNILMKDDYHTFKSNLENKNFDDAVASCERHWTSKFGNDSKVIIKEVLDRKFNDEVEKLLKRISDISDIGEYNNLVETLNKISSLKKNNEIDKIGYKPTINSDNENIINEKITIQERYADVLKNGVSNITISFGAESKGNEPLGFECGDEDEIILELDTFKYHYDNKSKCEGLKISWKSLKNSFKSAKYSVKVTEEDTVDNDHYNKGSFRLYKDDLIKIYYGLTVKKDIESGYFIEFKR